MFQLRNLIGRMNVSKPKARFDDCEDFFILVVESYVLACVMHKFEIGLTENVWLKNAAERKHIITNMCDTIVKEFVDFNFHLIKNHPKDMVKSHSTHLMSQGLFYLNFRDSIKEGDGRRVLICWKYMLPIFISTQRKNYAKEALLMIFKHHFVFSPRMSQQLLYSRFVNTSGTVGGNIPGDLHNEHLNRLCKEAVKGLGPNKNVEGITRVSRALGVLEPILSKFDNDCCVPKSSGRHCIASQDKDRCTLVQELIKQRPFEYVKHRKMNGISKPKSLLHKLSKDQLEIWISDHIQNNFSLDD